MALTDWDELNAAPQKGGQGEVRKVAHRASGQVGALKQLHKENQNNTERRFRFLNEVSALRALNGDGAPLVLDANETEWRNYSVQLYLIMEWIDGVTLSQKANKKRATIDEGKEALTRIVTILEHCHALPIYHRDIKPDNIVMRGGHWSDPVLVDFGMSWANSEDKPTDFETPNGQEIGNRFLRLPEHSSGGDHHDNRSDVCMAVGLLFFSLTGCAPRTLDDGHGFKPHEAKQHLFSTAILNDPRWRRLRRLFNVGFYYRIDGRFQSASELLKWLKSLDDDTMENKHDNLVEEIGRLHDVLASAEARRIEEIRPLVERANQQFFDGFQTIIAEAGLEGGGQGPTFIDRGLTSRFHLIVQRKSTSQPHTCIEHRVMVEGETVSAGFRLDKYVSLPGEWTVYYSAAAADSEGLLMAMSDNPRKVAAVVIRSLREKWEKWE